MQYTLNRLWLRARERPGNQSLPRSSPTMKQSAACAARSPPTGARSSRRSASTAKFVGGVFRALTAGSSLAEAGGIHRVCRIGRRRRGDEIAVREIVEAFRAPGANFLCPKSNRSGRSYRLCRHQPRKPDPPVEEAVRLAQAEARAAQQWRRLNDRLGSDEPLSRRELATVLAWREETNPSEAWARRYGGNYAAVSALIRRYRCWRNNRLAIAGVGVVIIGLALYAVMRDFQQRAETAKALALNEEHWKRTISLLDTMIFEVPVQVTQAARALTTTAARRAEDTGALRDPRGDDRAVGTDDAATSTELQPTTDRPSEQSPQGRPNPALATMTFVVTTIRSMVGERPSDTQLQRLFAVVQQARRHPA